MKLNWSLFVTAAGFFLFVLNALLNRNASQLGDSYAVVALTSFVMIVTGLVATALGRNSGTVLRILSVLILLFVLGVCFVAY